MERLCSQVIVIISAALEDIAERYTCAHAHTRPRSFIYGCHAAVTPPKGCVLLVVYLMTDLNEANYLWSLALRTQ